VRTRLRVEAATRTYYGSWAVISVARRRDSLTLREHKLSASSGRSPRERKRAITAASSSRWAERSLARARTLELAWRNLVASDGHSLPYPPDRAEAHGPVGERAALRQQESYEKRRRSSTPDEAGGGRRRLETGESRSAGRIRLAKARHNLDAAASGSAWRSGGRPSASSSAPRRGRSAPRQPDGPLAPDEHWLELRSEGPRALAIVPVADTGSRARRLRLPREEVAAQARAAPCATTSSSTGQAPLVSRRLVVVPDGEPRPDMEHLRSAP